jgi:hypothetical protein
MFLESIIPALGNAVKPGPDAMSAAMRRDEGRLDEEEDEEEKERPCPLAG